MSEALEVVGGIAAAVAVGGALLLPSPRARAAALVAALALAVALVAGEAWDGPLAELAASPAVLTALIAGAVVLLAALAAVFDRWAWAFPLAALATLPIRIPVDIGAESSNLLVPLYAVIGAGVIAALVRALRDPGPRGLPAPLPLRAALAAAIVVYAAQATYSSDTSLAAQNIGFFLVPFSALFALLAATGWDRRLLAAAFVVVVGESLVFAVIGIGQHFAESIFWNPDLEASNDFHFYFRANSLFWDPNIYGRYLVLATVLALAAFVWARDRVHLALLAAGIAILWIGLLFSYSQSSFIALLVGVLLLCALRWSAPLAAIATPIVAIAVVAGILVLVPPDDGGTRSQADSITSGRSTLLEGGLELAGERPLAGHGSASFPTAFRESEGIPEGRTATSHTEPVTVAAEQGAVGIVVYVALLGVVLLTLFGGMRSIAPGLGAARGKLGLDRPRPGGLEGVARIGLATAFCALIVHTIGYAGYLTDPLTWTLIAIGAALAPRRRPAEPAAAPVPPSRAPTRAGAQQPAS